MIASPLCSVCKHLQIGPAPDPDPEDGPTIWWCRAYPAGIPSEIITNNVDHRRPHGNDHGVQFEQAEPNQASSLGVEVAAVRAIEAGGSPDGVLV